MKIKSLFIGLLGLAITACDESTNEIGIYTDADNIDVTTAIYEAHTRSIAADSVLSNSNSSYIGRISDLETGLKFKADFLAQFSTLENYELPALDRMVKNEQGMVEADSIVEIRLYFNKYYGSDTNPMKLEIYELDTTHVIREDSIYYSNADLTQYINKKRPEPLVQKVYTAKDFTVSEDILESDSYMPSIQILLPLEYGTHILRKYYENKDFFKDSYHFIRHVCPGFYFKLTDGDGTLIKVKVGTMNVYFKYDHEGKIETGMSRFAATPEVMQSTHIENEALKTWLQDKTDCTHLITPAGVFTEMALPVDEIYNGHDNDSINQAKLTLYRYNARIEAEKAIDVPQNILMVRKKDIHKFFEERRVADAKTSFVSSFDSNYNTYSFSNIGNMISACRHEKKKGLQETGWTEEQWMQENEDWNKVVLIPVELNIDDNNNIVSVTHDMGLGSARLVGGDTNTIKIQVTYSSFK